MPKPKNSKKFIDKKNSVSFQLVSRSQQDPLVADDSAPQNVLRPIFKGQQKHLREQNEQGSQFGGDDDDEEIDYTHIKDPKDRMVEWPENVEAELSIKLKKVKFDLPKEVFASVQEEEVGLLNKTTESKGLGLGINPEVREAIAALEEDFDFSEPNNQLEDDFVNMADGACLAQEFDEDDLDSVKSDVDSNAHFSDRSSYEEEKPKKKSYYSMISTVTRSELLDLQEARFQRLYDEYDNDDVCEDASKNLSMEEHCKMIQKEVAQWEEQTKLLKYEPDTSVKEKTLQLFESISSESSDMEEEDESEDSEGPSKIPKQIAQVTPIYGPKVVEFPSQNKKKKKIVVNPKTGMPEDLMGISKLTIKALSEWNNSSNGSPSDMDAPSVISRVSEFSVRNPHETLEEKRRRKKLCKEYQKERRIEKKVNKTEYKESGFNNYKVELNRNKNKVVRGFK